MTSIAMSKAERDEAVKVAMQAMGDGFAGEESFAVNPETGEIVIWINGGGNDDTPLARLSFTLASATFVSMEEFKREYLGDDGDPVDTYFARLHLIGDNASPEEKFWLFMNDEKLMRLEERINYSDDATTQRFNDRLMECYTAWLGAMTQQGRRDLRDYNYAWNSANQNHLLAEMIDTEGCIRTPT